MAYSNVTDLISRVRDLATQLGKDLDEAADIYSEYLRVGGEARTDPFFFDLDPATGQPTTTPRIDLPFSPSQLALGLSALLILSGGADNGLPGLAAQVIAARAALDKVKG